MCHCTFRGALGVLVRRSADSPMQQEELQLELARRENLGGMEARTFASYD